MVQGNETFEGEATPRLWIARDAGHLVTQEVLGWSPEGLDDYLDGGGAKLVPRDVPPTIDGIALKEPIAA